MAFRARWGVEQVPTGENPRYDITMVQRTPGRMGRSLGKTTGWIHREVLRQAGVRQLTGAIYDHIDDLGLTITIDGAVRLLEAGTIIVCAGQTPERKLYEDLQKAGIETHLIGGAVWNALCVPPLRYNCSPRSPVHALTYDLPC